MKEMTIPTRMYIFVTNLLDALIRPKKASTPLHPEKESETDKRKNLDRKDFRYYMQVIDHDSQELVGYLSDISSGGFKLDSEDPILLNKEFRFRMELTCEVANKAAMMFVARSRWCQVDPFDPFCYNVGFQLIDISPEDVEIFHRLIERYGSNHENVRVDLRRTNMW